MDKDVIALRRSAATSPQAGSIEERDTLEAIEQARLEEMYPQTRARRQRALKRHWSDREHALGN